MIRRAAPAGRLRGWLPLVVAGVVYAGVVCVVIAVRAESSSDFRDFWRTAGHFRETGQISSELGVHNYLPFFAVFMAPWALLPLRAAAVLFTLLSLGLFTLTVVLVETTLAGGLKHRPRAATLAALGLMLPYVHSCAVLGQMSLLLVFLIVASWVLVERGKEWSAGAALGLATLIKLLPAALIAFFLLKRRWRVAGAAIGVVGVLGFGVPLATLGFEETVRQHQDFYRRALRGHGAKATILAPKPQKAKYSNNALPIVLRRLLSEVNGDPSESDPQRRLLVNFAELRLPVIWTIYLALLGAICAVSIAAGLGATKPWPPPEEHAATRVRAQFGVWCCLMLLAAPLVWTHYLPLAYWPLALVAHESERVGAAGRSARRAGLIALLIWLVGAVLLAWPAARAAGAQLWSVLALWAVMLSRSCLRWASATPAAGP